MILDKKTLRCKIALLAALLSGCASAPSRFYTIDSAATPDGSPPVQTTVMVEPVSVPAAVDQPQLVLQVAPNRVEVEEFDRWDAPLTESIARAVARDLSVLLSCPDVATAPMADFNPAYTVTINIQRFESVRNEGASLDAVWVVRNAAGKTRSGRTTAQEASQGQGFDALAAAHSRALAKLSKDIAAAIKASANDAA
jgi:uncharacterized lipoprotein YmbA